MRLVYNVYDDENLIESKQFDNFPEALEYAKQGLITYICEEDLDCPECEEKIVWTWDSTWNDEEAIANVADQLEECAESNLDEDIEVSVSGPAEEVVPLANIIFDSVFDLDWDEPVNEVEITTPDCADELGYEDEPATKDLNFDEEEFEVGEPEIVADYNDYETEESEEFEVETSKPEIYEDPIDPEENKEKNLEIGKSLEDAESNDSEDLSKEYKQVKLEENENSESLVENKTIQTYTLDELSEIIYNDGFELYSEEDNERGIGGYTDTYIIHGPFSNDTYKMFKVSTDRDGGDAGEEEVDSFDSLLDVAEFLQNEEYVNIVDLEKHLGFEEWPETQDQIEENLEDDLTDQEFAEQFKQKLEEIKK